MPHSTPEQLRFPPVAGLSVRGDFEGSALSSDFGAVLLRGVDRQIGLSQRLAAAFDDRRHAGYIFGLTGNTKLARSAEPHLVAARRAHAVRCRNARRLGVPTPPHTRTYHEFTYAADSWPAAARVILKAEVMALGDNPCYVVTSLDLPSPEALYRDLYCARGQDENFIKMMKNDLACDRTSDHRFIANHMRLFFSAAAYVLHHSLRSEVLGHTELTRAQPMTVIVKLFKIAVRVVQYKDRIKLHLPSAYPLKELLHTATEILYRGQSPPGLDTG